MLKLVKCIDQQRAVQLLQMLQHELLLPLLFAAREVAQQYVAVSNGCGSNLKLLKGCLSQAQPTLTSFASSELLHHTPYIALLIILWY